jgi:hypothetical protein
LSLQKFMRSPPAQLVATFFPQPERRSKRQLAAAGGCKA